MREIRLYGSEGGGAVRSPYPYQGDFAYRVPVDVNRKAAAPQKARVCATDRNNAQRMPGITAVEFIYELTVLNQETKRERPSSKGTFGS